MKEGKINRGRERRKGRMLKERRENNVRKEEGREGRG